MLLTEYKNHVDNSDGDCLCRESSGREWISGARQTQINSSILFHYFLFQVSILTFIILEYKPQTLSNPLFFCFNNFTSHRSKLKGNIGHICTEAFGATLNAVGLETTWSDSEDRVWADVSAAWGLLKFRITPRVDCRKDGREYLDEEAFPS